jgi:hypothetical protein
MLLTPAERRASPFRNKNGQLRLSVFWMQMDSLCLGQPFSDQQLKNTEDDDSDAAICGMIALSNRWEGF